MPAPQEGEEVIFEEKREEVITADGEREVTEVSHKEVVEIENEKRKGGGKKK